jgi:hypothetical protein
MDPRIRSHFRRMDKALRDCVQIEFDRTHPGRKGTFVEQITLLANILAKYETAGDAMRYLDRKGELAWRATPQLRDRICGQGIADQRLPIARQSARTIRYGNLCHFGSRSGR